MEGGGSDGRFVLGSGLGSSSDGGSGGGSGTEIHSGVFSSNGSEFEGAGRSYKKETETGNVICSDVSRVSMLTIVTHTLFGAHRFDSTRFNRKKQACGGYKRWPSAGRIRCFSLNFEPRRSVGMMDEGKNSLNSNLTTVALKQCRTIEDQSFERI